MPSGQPVKIDLMLKNAKNICFYSKRCEFVLQNLDHLFILLLTSLTKTIFFSFYLCDIMSYMPIITLQCVQEFGC